MKTSIAELARTAKAIKEQRLEADHAAKLLKIEEDAANAELMTAMQASGLTFLDINGCSARIEEKQKPYISDFAALEGYIREHGALDLLQKRLTESAVKLRWDDGITVPGVGMMTEQKLTVK